jgi:hypothetical protein
LRDDLGNDQNADYDHRDAGGRTGTTHEEIFLMKKVGDGDVALPCSSQISWP